MRDALGISQKVLAIDLKVSQPTISAWESGLKKMSNASAAKVADYFHVSMDYLLGRSLACEEIKQPTVSDDDRLRADIIDRVQGLSDPALARVSDFLDGLRAGQEISSDSNTSHDC